MGDSREPIAIIGMGCRFPGAINPGEFWDLLRDGVDAITEVPASRFDIDDYYDPEQGKPWKINSRWGGFLPDLDRFDAGFFGITPREAESMDPQQRVLLEVAYEALEDAGVPLERVTGSNTGVFVAIAHSDFSEQLLGEGVEPGPYSGTGRSHSLAPNRISYSFNLHGPSIALDTACSSSLVAVHLACQSLNLGESDFVLAGGVNFILEPTTSIGFAQAHMLSSDGRCKTFDASADGYVRSEACAVLALKRLSDALRDGDTPLAVIRGTAINEDGRTNGIMAPSETAQEAVIRSALRDADLKPTDIDYLEAHGTGTPLGDPIELDAVKAVLTQGRSSEFPLIVGSGKTNVGHTETAAGMVSLVRTVLILQHHLVPPHLHLRELNPQIDLEGVPLQISRSLAPLKPHGSLLRAGINGFGFGGTNCHVIVEEVPATVVEPTSIPTRPEILTLSARSPEALMATAAAYRDALPRLRETAPLYAVCSLAALRRTHHGERLALVAESYDDMLDLLHTFERGERDRAMSRGSATGQGSKMAFVFSGMGSHWVGMGRQLLQEEPVFREAIDRCDTELRRYVDWRVRDEILADDARSRLDDIGVLQPVLFAVAVALADLWRSWGVQPDGVVGHSFGEIAAAYEAGVLSLEEAVRVVSARGAALRPASGRGSMLAVGLSSEDSKPVLEGYGDRVAIGACNSPTSTVLSGDPQVLREISGRLEGDGIFCRPVNTNIAFHSAHMDPLIEPFSRLVGEVHPSEGAVPLYSTVNGALQNGVECTTSYWIRNLREPVEFARTIERMILDGYDTFLEVGPHPVLVHGIKETAQASQNDIRALSSLRRNEDERKLMLQSLGELHANGRTIAWSNLYENLGAKVELPAYPWQRERYWPEGATGKRVNRKRNGGHPLLGHPVISAVHSGKRVWEIEVSLDEFPYLADHRIGDSTLFPAAGFIEMSLAVAQALGPGPHVVENLEIVFGLVLAADQVKTVQVIASSVSPGTFALQFLSREEGDEPGEDAWRQHATSTVRSESIEEHLPSPSEMSPDDFVALTDKLTWLRGQHEASDSRSLTMGPAFASLDGEYVMGKESVARIQLPEAAGSAAGYNLHPVLLDASFQTFSALTPPEGYLPVGIGAVRVYDVPKHGLWARAARITENKYDEVLEGVTRLFNAAGDVVADVQGLRYERRKIVGDETVDDWLYQVRWDVSGGQSLEDIVRLPETWQGNWLVMADRLGVGERLVALLEARGSTCAQAFVGERFQKIGPGKYELNPVQPNDFRQLLGEIGDSASPLKGVVHLWSGDDHAAAGLSAACLNDAQDLGSISAMHLVQGLAARETDVQPRLWLVTWGAQAVHGLDESGLTQSPLLGLARVIANEHPDLKCSRIDLDSQVELSSAGVLISEMAAEDREDEVAYRDGTRYVRRLVRFTTGQQTTDNAQDRVVVTSDTPFRLATDKPGILDHLYIGQVHRVAPASGEVEIKVAATGLNFRDVMSAMGILPGYPEGLGPLGYECAGIVTAVGPGVSEFRAGDEVVALAKHAFGSYIVVDAQTTVTKPRNVTFEEVVTIPITFLTAYYALQHIARIQPGESVLIHAAAGGVGLAAVQIAQRAGATVFATAGSPQKRDYLRALGVTHVMDSRSLQFADEILQLTNGRGVDIVLNSLAGEFIPKSLSVLAPYGRFLEIGRRDIYGDSQIGLAPFQRNLSFSAVDLDRLQQERPELVRTLLREILALVEEGSLRPLPSTVFPITEAADAFRHMAQAKHIGKIVIAMNAEGAHIRVADASRLRPDGTYLITGGFGGLGLKLAQWMVDRGARSLVLVGRSGPTTETGPVLESLRRAGCVVTGIQVDVARQLDVDNLMARIRESLPPLRGVIHAAGVLDDGTLIHLDRVRFQRVMAPKIQGAWNLHLATRDLPLDFFILFSSLASVLGSAGQGNYAAANQFLDSLAVFRRTCGLPALSIAWGPWSDVGMVMDSNLLDRLAAQGVAGISPQYGLTVLERLLAVDGTQVMVARIDWKRRLEVHPEWRDSPALSVLAAEVKSAGSSEVSVADSLGLILNLPPENRQDALETYLSDQAGRVMGISSRKVSARQSLAGLGLDSLMAVELRNRIRVDLDVDVPTKAFLEGAAIEQISTMMLMQLFRRGAAGVEGDNRSEELEEITL